MKKPKYPEQLCSLVFIYIGCTFTVVGLLAFIGILKPSAHSMVQAPRVMRNIFLSIGITFFMIGIVLKILASGKDKLYIDLVNHGVKVNGTVEKVYLTKYMQYWNKYPYRILYTYTHQGKEYHHKSHLLWEKPALKEKDFVKVYVNDSGKSAIQI